MIQEYMVGTKCNQLSKQFKMDAKEVYNSIAKFKKFAAEIDSNQVSEPAAVEKVKVKDNPELLKQIVSYFVNYGFHSITMIQLQEHIRQNLPKTLKKAPSTSYIREILRDHFKLEYKKFKSANYKYRDPSFNEKRLWVSRILASFLYHNAIIISLDESGFRSDTTKDMKWQFKSYVSKKVN